MRSSLNVKAVVLAAGKSTRFKTKKSKLSYTICGRPMVMYPISALELLDIPIAVVLGYQADVIRKMIEGYKVKNVSFVLQAEQLGTGHAVSCSRDTWEDFDDIFIMNGDMPLITSDLIQDVILTHKNSSATLTFVSAMVLDPSSYGRVSENDGKYSVIEDKDCTDDERQISKVNVGIYVINRIWLAKNIECVAKSDSGEFYLTDLIKLASDQNLNVKDVSVPFDYVRGVNNFQELWNAEQIKRSEFIKHWMAEGVRFEMAQSIHVDIDVKIGQGSFIGTGSHLLGKTVIGEDCFVGAFSIVENTTIGDSTVIHSHSVIQDSQIGGEVHVGPFARLRNNVSIGNNVQIGNFVEIKNTEIGDNSKTKHLTYLGDAKIGKAVNIGAGTITCNYDGANKFKTIIEDEAFVGSNNTLIAPINIGKGAYTAGGSTITQDVPAGGLGIGRSRQENKKDYAQKILDKKKDEIIEEESENANFNFRGAVKTKHDRQNNL
ncbi:MAG: Bifunctional protein GlmU [candidate division TM6 bacterium GW2011_GWF2_37_49]|nr:MAG: Bifunctional protein GlmU [candidate division TM6 bacterium GW2011_GWF2_37_49]